VRELKLGQPDLTGVKNNTCLDGPSSLLIEITRPGEMGKCDYDIQRCQRFDWHYRTSAELWLNFSWRLFARPKFHTTQVLTTNIHKFQTTNANYKLQCKLQIKIRRQTVQTQYADQTEYFTESVETFSAQIPYWLQTAICSFMDKLAKSSNGHLFSFFLLIFCGWTS